MGKSLSKERARVLKGMGYAREEHHWFRETYTPTWKAATKAYITPLNGEWYAECKHRNWPVGPDGYRRQTFPDPITAAIWIQLELSQEAGV